MRPNDSEFRATLPASLAAVESFCTEFRQLHSTKCPYVDAFSAELLLREALTNSVVHGCSNDPSNHLCCVLRARKNRLLIAVQDAGSGFDWRAAWNRTADASDTGGRGVEIYRKYATHVRFNQTGNAVMLMKRSREEYK